MTENEIRFSIFSMGLVIYGGTMGYMYFADVGFLLLILAVIPKRKKNNKRNR